MVRSAHTGWAHDLTSEGPPTPEVETSVALLADSIAGRADILPPAFVRSRTNVGLDATWVHLAGALDLATTPPAGAHAARLSVAGAAGGARPARTRVHGLLRRACRRQRQHQRSAARPSVNSPSRPPERRPRIHADREHRCGRERRPRPGLLRTSNGPTPLLSRRTTARSRGSRGRRRDRSAQG
jgi:hypothetical protein